MLTLEQFIAIMLALAAIAAGVTFVERQRTKRTNKWTDTGLADNEKDATLLQGNLGDSEENGFTTKPLRIGDVLKQLAWCLAVVAALIVFGGDL